MYKQFFEKMNNIKPYICNLIIWSGIGMYAQAVPEHWNKDLKQCTSDIQTITTQLNKNTLTRNVGKQLETCIEKIKSMNQSLNPHFAIESNRKVPPSLLSIDGQKVDNTSQDWKDLLECVEYTQKPEIQEPLNFLTTETYEKECTHLKKKNFCVNIKRLIKLLSESSEEIIEATKKISQNSRSEIICLLQQFFGHLIEAYWDVFDLAFSLAAPSKKTRAEWWPEWSKVNKSVMILSERVNQCNINKFETIKQNMKPILDAFVQAEKFLAENKDNTKEDECVTAVLENLKKIINVTTSIQEHIQKINVKIIS